MAIDVKTLETEGKEVEQIDNRHAQRDVLVFMQENKKTAYTQKDISVELGMKPQQARQILHALKAKGTVSCKAIAVSTKSGTMKDQIHWKLE